MFEKLYIEKSLYDVRLDEILRENLDDRVEVEYVSACKAECLWKKTSCIEKNTNGMVNNINNDSNVPADGFKKCVFAGCSRVFLDKVSDYAVIAVLSYSVNDDLFKYKYAIDGLDAIDYDYLEMIYARFNNIPLTIAETKNLLIREMNMEEACKLFKLTKDYPELFEESNFVSQNVMAGNKGGLHNARVGETENAGNENVGNYIKELADAYIRNAYDLCGYGMWSVFRKSDGVFIGFAGLYDSAQNGDSYTGISYYVEPQFRRNGYAVEASCAVIEYASEYLGLEEIRCVVNEENIASRKVAEKIGIFL